MFCITTVLVQHLTVDAYDWRCISTETYKCSPAYVDEIVRSMPPGMPQWNRSVFTI